MVSKKILITITDPPYSNNDFKESLRVALGITAGYREHHVDVLLTGQAVYFVVNANSNTLQRFLAAFRMLDSSFFVDSSSLNGDIPPEMIVPPFVLKNIDEILQLYRDADLNLSL